MNTEFIKAPHVGCSTAVERDDVFFTNTAPVTVWMESVEIHNQLSEDINAELGW